MKTSLPVRYQRITNNLKVVIQGAHPEVDLDNAIWAINWFNMHSSFFYKIYAMMAAPLVWQVKGRLLFKGSLYKKLEGDELYDRDSLLIMYYQTTSHFLRLISKKFFQLISIFRLLAVREFTFGFLERLDDGSLPPIKPEKLTGETIYLVHHFQASKDFLRNHLEAITKIAHDLNVSLYFSGERKAIIGRDSGKGVIKITPLFIDGILIYKAAKTSDLEVFRIASKYAAIKERMSSSSLYLFKREK